MSSHVGTSWVGIVALLLVLAACGDEEQNAPSQMAAGSKSRGSPAAESGGASGAAGSGGSTGSDSAGTTSAAAGAAGMDAGEPTLSSLYDNELWSCSNPMCHGGGLAGVDFSSKDAAWASLINQPANPKFQCAALGKQRVVPGDPDNSLMVLKLDINAPCGQQMPPGGVLSDRAVARIREWIALGAKNN